MGKTPGKPGTAAFAGWTAIGACVLLALLTPFTIGAIAFLVPLAGVAALLMWPAGRSAAAFGAFRGYSRFQRGLDTHGAAD